MAVRGLGMRVLSTVRDKNTTDKNHHTLAAPNCAVCSLQIPQQQSRRHVQGPREPDDCAQVRLACPALVVADRRAVHARKARQLVLGNAGRAAGCAQRVSKRPCPAGAAVWNGPVSHTLIINIRSACVPLRLGDSPAPRSLAGDRWRPTNRKSLDLRLFGVFLALRRVGNNGSRMGNIHCPIGDALRRWPAGGSDRLRELSRGVT